MRVYLAGSMTNSSIQAATEWRSFAALELQKYGIKAYSPTRGKKFDPTKPISLDSEKEMGGPENTNKAINMRDYLDCIKADAILAFLDVTTPYPSGGTIIEFAWAWHLRIPIIAAVPDNTYYTNHPMISELITYRVDTIDEGIKIVASVLLP